MLIMIIIKIGSNNTLVIGRAVIVMMMQELIKIKMITIGNIKK